VSHSHSRGRGVLSPILKYYSTSLNYQQAASIGKIEVYIVFSVPGHEVDSGLWRMAIAGAHLNLGFGYNFLPS